MSRSIQWYNDRHLREDARYRAGSDWPPAFALKPSGKMARHSRKGPTLTEKKKEEEEKETAMPRAERIIWRVHEQQLTLRRRT
jgi:hypothetical protein